MRKQTGFLILLFISAACFSQQNFKRTTVYIQLGGNGLLGSVNVERQLTKKPGLGVHAGTGIYGAEPSSLTIPLGLNYLLPLHKSGSFVDIGFGATFCEADVKLYATVDRRTSTFVPPTNWHYIPHLGYRKQTRKNLMYRFSFSSLINYNGFLPLLEFSLGKSF